MDDTKHRQASVLVAIGINPDCGRLLGRAAELARGLDGQLLALHIHPPHSGTGVSDANVDWNLQQARQLGAIVHIVEGRDIADTLIHWGRDQHVTHLVLGQSDISRWQEVVRGSVINRILRMRSGIDLYIVADDAE